MKKIFIIVNNFKSSSVHRSILLSSSPQIPITLHKDKDYDEEGREVLKCGFKIGGGIDQDFKKSPQGYTDNVSTVLYQSKSPDPDLIIIRTIIVSREFM